MEPRKRKRDGGVDTYKIAVRGLPKDTSEDILRAYFSRYGTVIKVVILTRGSQSKPRGVALLLFLEPGAVEKVLAHDHVINNKKVTVERGKDNEAELGKENELGGNPLLSVEENQHVQQQPAQLWRPSTAGAYHFLVGEAPHHIPVEYVKIDSHDKGEVRKLANNLRDATLLVKDPGDVSLARSSFLHKDDFSEALLGTIPHILQSVDIGASNNAEITDAMVRMGELFGIERPSVYNGDFGNPVSKKFLRKKRLQDGEASMQLQKFAMVLEKTQTMNSEV